MQKNALLRVHQRGQRVKGGSKALRHVIGAAVMNRRPNEFESESLAFVPQLGGIEPVDLQIDIVLQIMNRRDSVFVFEPFEIGKPRIFTHQQMVGYLTH
jgi:hypothetical protein